MDEHEVVINATRDQIEEFKGSLLWKDMQEELKRWLEMFAIQKSNTIDMCISGEIGGSSALASLAEVKGRERTIEYIMAMPDVFLQILEDKKNDSGRK